MEREASSSYKKLLLENQELSNENTNKYIFHDHIPEVFLRSIFNAVPAGISITTDTSCQVIRHNPIAADFLRIEPWESFSHSDSNPPKVKLLLQGRELEPSEMPIQRSAWNGETVSNQEIEFVWEDGVRKLARFSSKPLYGDNGEIIGSIATFEDITERKQAEGAVQRSDQRIAEILESMTEAFYAVDADWRISYVNQRIEKWWNRKKEELVGHSLWDIFPQSDSILGQNELLRSMQERVPLNFDTFSPILHTWLEVNVYPTFDGGVAVYFRDITERKQIQDYLQEERRILKAIIENTETQLVYLDQDFNFIWVNPAYATGCRRQVEDFVGRNHFELFPDEENEAIFRKVRDTGKPIVFKAKSFAHPDRPEEGVTYWDWSLTPVTDTSGRVTGLVFSLTDVSETIRTGETLRKSQKREELLSTVSSRLLESEDPQSIVNDLCKKTLEYLECDVFFNYLVDERQNRMHLNAYRGIPEAEVGLIEWLDFGTAVCGCAALEARRIVAENIPETPDLRTDLVRSYGVLAYACHPLMVGGQVLGTLSFGSRSRKFFTDEELAVMKDVADHIAIAVNRLLTNRKLQETSEQYRGLAEKLRDVDLRQSEEKFSRVFHLSPAMMAINRLDNTEYIDVNGAWLTARGYNREEIIGTRSSEFGDDPVFREEVMRKLRKQGRIQNLEVTYTTKTGEVRPAIVSVEIIHFEGIPCILTASFDTTEQKRLERERIKREVNIATDKVQQSLESYKKIVSHTVGLGEVNFYSEKMKNIYRQAMMYHNNRAVPVLIQGETGVGKDVLAKIIHYGELQKVTPMIDINCAAISANLFESELFGYEAGAFTGSLSKGQIGKFDLANGGTLFLDEIGDIPIELQAKLLRVIEEKEFFRIGGLKKIKTDVRIICATNVDLERRVEEGSFRKDLFYRLGVGYIKIPPLRERTEEILPLAHMFMEEFSRQKGKRFNRISGEAAAMLLKHLWPGNVREMRNAFDWITYMFDDVELKPEHLELMFEKTGSGYSQEKNIVPSEPIRGYTISGLIDHYITQVMKENNGDVNKASKVLGITKPTLYYHLRRIKNNNAV